MYVSSKMAPCAFRLSPPVLLCECWDYMLPTISVMVVWKQVWDLVPSWWLFDEIWRYFFFAGESVSLGVSLWHVELASFKFFEMWALSCCSSCLPPAHSAVLSGTLTSWKCINKVNKFRLTKLLWQWHFIAVLKK